MFFDVVESILKSMYRVIGNGVSLNGLSWTTKEILGSKLGYLNCLCRLMLTILMYIRVRFSWLELPGNAACIAYRQSICE